MFNSWLMIITLRECSTWFLIMNSHYACYVLPLCLCTTLLTSRLVHSWFIRILGYRIILNDSYCSILTVIVNNSGCAYSVDGDIGYMVYKWGFSYLDYPLEVSISWIYLLSTYNWLCHICLSHHLMSHSYSVLVLTTWFSMHILIRIYRYTCVWPCTSLGIHNTTRWGVMTPLDPHVQVLKFGAGEFILLIRVAQRKRNGSAKDRLKPYHSGPLTRL